MPFWSSSGIHGEVSFFFYLEDRPKTCNHAYSLRIGFVGPIPFMAVSFMAYEGGVPTLTTYVDVLV